MAAYELILLFLGLAILGAVVLPRLVADKPLSFPMIYVLAGITLFSLPLGIELPDPVVHSELTERLTELVVIIALMGAGLKIDRPFDLSSWSTTWRLLGITMPLTIAITALITWQILGTLPATAVLLGAVIAPTDPVLASDVQATPPTEDVNEDIDASEQEGSIRFALTSEAGLNDGLAFPFTYLAIAIAAAPASSFVWLGDWILVDLVYKIVIGAIIGYAGGKVMAWVIFGSPATTELANVMAGGEALAATFLTYALAELVHGYGFLAVFIAAVVLRLHEWEDEYYLALHDFAIITERLLMATILVLFGGAIVGGLLNPLTWLHVLVGAIIVLIIRPVAGMIGLIGSSVPRPDRLVVAGFGIRGIGSFYYLAFALNEVSFQEIELLRAAEELWALIGFIVLLSIVIHGSSANYVMNALERHHHAQRSSGAVAGTRSD